MNSLTAIPALYALEGCPLGSSEILICVEIDIFLFHHGTGRLYAGIITGIPSMAEWMEYPMATQVPFTPASFQNVKTYFEGVSLIDHITIHSQTGDTVEHAVEAVGCSPAEIAKSPTSSVDGKPVMIIMAGDTGVNSSKFKACFHQKPSMVPYEQIGELIGHQSGAPIWR